MIDPPRKPPGAERDYERQLREMNDALLVSSVRQHELTEKAEKAEAALAESEEQLRRAIEESPVPIIMHAEDGEVLRISRSWTELTGYTIEDKSVLQRWLTKAYGYGGDDVRTAVKQLFESGEAMRAVEFEVVTRAGDRRLWSFSASSPGALRDGRRFIVGMAEDITDRKQAMQALRESEEHLTMQRAAEEILRKSEERFRTMANSSPMMIWMTDPGGHTSFLNRTYLEYAGVTAEQAPAFDWSGIVHPDDRGAYEAAFQTALQKRQSFHQRVRLRRFDGEWRWFEARGNPLFDGAGKTTGYIGSSADITDIYESQQRLKELDERKDEFLANMSHEIRSPLTGIMGYADMLLDRLKDPEDIECLNTIKESGNYLIEIVNDILDLAKIEAGKLVLNIEAVSVHSVVTEVQALMDVRARQKKLPLSLRYEGTLPESIQTDRTRLRQVLINLVSNAIKFTERGRVEIVARYIANDSLVEIEVVDTGVGIAPEHQEILFQPFTQADTTSTRQYGGTGLGLTITRRLVEMLGGSLSFESELDKGSTFRVMIPAGALQNVTQPPRAAAPAGLVAADLSLRDHRVLVVDDREEICYLVSRYIKDAGGRPSAVLDGEAAIEAMQAAQAADPFDAMILDIHMPGIDGYEVARRLRAKGFQAPIIALTAVAMVGDREKCLQAGCDDYLTKPIDRRKLVQLVAQHARSAREAGRESAKLRVLVVDDSYNACKFLTAYLEKRGYEVRSAYDGQSALAIARDFGPGLVIVDIRLPDMDGFQLTRRLKELDGIKKARFIGLSGYRDNDAGGAVEFDHFLEKPLDTACLSEILRSLSASVPIGDG